MKPAELAIVARFAQVGLRLLSQQVLTYLAFLATCLMWAHATLEPSGWTVMAASFFTLLVFWPAMYAEVRKREAQDEGNAE